MNKISESHELANQILANKKQLAQTVTDLHLQAHPQWIERYGEMGKLRCFEDAMYHIEYLAEAIKLQSPPLFNHYLEWAWQMLTARNIHKDDLTANIAFLSEAISKQFGEQERIVQEINRYLQAGIHHLEKLQPNIETWLKEENPLHHEATTYLNFLLQGKRRQAAEHIDELVKQGHKVGDLYEHIFQVTQYEVGVRWQRNEITVAHEHYCTAATQLIMSRLYPLIFSGAKKGNTMVACTVVDELHEIGIRMVSDFFEMDGWDTYYLGSNMPVTHLLQLLEEYNADLLALSVTLPKHVGKLEELIRVVRAKKTFENVKIMVGGYPFAVIPGLADQVGADATATSAREAVKTANAMVNN